MKEKEGIDIDNFLGALIGRAEKIITICINQHLDKLGYNIVKEHAIILILLLNKDGQSQQDLANTIFKDKSTITRLLAHLEELSFVVRVPDQNDKRNKLVYLTHKGKSLKPELLEIRNLVLKIASNDISTEDLETCKRVLKQIYVNFLEHKNKSC